MKEDEWESTEYCSSCGIKHGIKNCISYKQGKKDRDKFVIDNIERIEKVFCDGVLTEIGKMKIDFLKTYIKELEKELMKE